MRSFLITNETRNSSKIACNLAHLSQFTQYTNWKKKKRTFWHPQFHIDDCVGVSDDEKCSVVVNDFVVGERVSLDLCSLLLTLRSAKSVIMAGLVILSTGILLSPVSIRTTLVMLGRRAIASCVHSRPIFKKRHASSTSRSSPMSISMISSKRPSSWSPHVCKSSSLLVKFNDIYCIIGSGHTDLYATRQNLPNLQLVGYFI